MHKRNWAVVVAAVLVAGCRRDRRPGGFEPLDGR